MFTALLSRLASFPGLFPSTGCSKAGYVVFWVLIFSVLWNGYINGYISRSSFRLSGKGERKAFSSGLAFGPFLFVPGRTRLNWYGSEQKGLFKDSAAISLVVLLLWLLLFCFWSFKFYLLFILSYLEFSVNKIDTLMDFWMLNQILLHA